jgi:hypothetical protein
MQVLLEKQERGFRASAPPLTSKDAPYSLKDDPTFDEWQEIIAENRRKQDKEEGIIRENPPASTETTSPFSL